MKQEVFIVGIQQYRQACIGTGIFHEETLEISNSRLQ